MIKAEYRYPGLQPFETKDAALFYGREREARDLYAQVQVEKMVVLFSKSGMGKSSLLNAGLTPLLGKTALLPLRIRLSNEVVPLEQQFLNELESEEWKDAVVLDPALRKSSATLWEQVKAAKFTKNGEPAIPLFIFDQFEEVFTLYSPARRTRFLSELADLANGNPPETYLERLRARIRAGERLDVLALEASPRCKLIFSIRSDLLHLLNALSPLIPDIMRSRFELLPLNREQAEEAVTLPAMLRDPEKQFISKPFRFDDAALDGLLAFLTKDGTEDVESFQLQILCRAIELQVIQKNTRSVTPNLYGGPTGLGHIIRDFYIAKIEELPEVERMPARRMLEEQLITDSGRRRSVAEDDLLQVEHTSQHLLDRLVEMRLLRKEPRLRTFYYEISHDTLVQPILEKYRERRHEEEVRAEAVRLEAEKKEAEAMREAAETRAREEEQKRKVAESQRRKANLLSIAAVLGFLLAIGVGWWALEQKEVADAARNEAEQEREKTQKALDKYVEEQKAREKLATDKLLGTVETLQRSGNVDIALRKLEEARAEGNTDPRIESKMNELKNIR